MELEKPKIKIPDPWRDPWERFQKQFSWMFVLIIGAMLIGFITMLFMVAQLVIEASRFNSVLYQESEQLKIQERNIENTIDQQKLIIESLESIKESLQELKK